MNLKLLTVTSFSRGLLKRNSTSCQKERNFTHNQCQAKKRVSDEERRTKDDESSGAWMSRGRCHTHLTSSSPSSDDVCFFPTAHCPTHKHSLHSFHAPVPPCAKQHPMLSRSHGPVHWVHHLTQQWGSLPTCTELLVNAGGP